MNKKRSVYRSFAAIAVISSLMVLSTSLTTLAQPTVTANSNLAFGTVVSGGGIYSVALANASEGKVTIRGTNRRVYVTLVPPATLTSGANSVTYTWAAAYNNTADNPGAATAFTSTAANFVLSYRTGANYYAYIYIYGSINLSGTVPSGTYTGNFVVRASYNAGGTPNRTATITVTCTVIQGLTLASSGPLTFGTVVAGTTPAAINAQTSSSAVSITATGNGGSSVTVTYPASASLSSGGNNLTYTPSLYGAQSSASRSSSTSVANGSTVTLGGTTGSAGNYYFWLGGSLAAIPSGQPAGNYSGPFTLTIHY